MGLLSAFLLRPDLAAEEVEARRPTAAAFTATWDATRAATLNAGFYAARDLFYTATAASTGAASEDATLLGIAAAINPRDRT